MIKRPHFHVRTSFPWRCSRRFSSPGIEFLALLLVAWIVQSYSSAPPPQTSSAAPPQPVNVTLGNVNPTALIVSWDSNNHSGIFRVELLESNCSSNTSHNPSTETTNLTYTFGSLKPNTQYCAKVRAEDGGSSSNWVLSKLQWTNASSPIAPSPSTAPVTSTLASAVVTTVPAAASSVAGTLSPESSTTTQKEAQSSDSTLAIALGTVLALLVVLAVCILVYVWFKKRRTRLPCQGFFQIDNVSSPEVTPNDKKGPVVMSKFKMHCAMLHADSDYRFSEEFKSCPAAKKVTWTNSDNPENNSKNRFTNVVAYDHSRVVLSLNDGDPESHYINANFVDGYEKPNAYIATQGPLANTMNDFWKMVWEQNCHVIVMITNIIEKGRHKCAMYWPSQKEASRDYGVLKVTFLGEEVFAHYTVRTFEVKPLDGCTHYTQFKFPSRRITIGANWDPADDVAQPMLVTQYHYTGWPDHGAPENGLEYPATDFILKSGAATKEAGPIIVHCSAGVGRSGAYILIQSMIRRLHQTGDLDIYGFLTQMRKQRNHLVQEQSQYIFVHDALLQYIETSMTLAVPMGRLKDHVQALRTETTRTEKSRMADEYQKVAVITVKEYDLKQAAKPCNQAKNRHAQFVPADSRRVKLFPRPGVEGSDYINASYLDGFWRREALIATQHPMESTTNNFWQMVWQENCRSVVMLTSQEELAEEAYGAYLPAVGAAAETYGNYRVSADSDAVRGDTNYTQLTMCSLSDPTHTRRLQHFHFLHWTEEGLPWSGQTLLQLISKVAEWQAHVKANADRFEEIGPVVVHCSFGVGRTGVYCLLHTLYDQLHREKAVALQQVARMYNFQRPCCLRSQAQYEFCYDTLVEYIDADCSVHLV